MKIFYHNDNDGKAAAAMLYLYLTKSGEDIPNLIKQDFYSVNYNDKVPDANLVSKSETVYVVDYSFTEATFDKLSKLCFKTDNNVYWFDHHKTSLEIYDYVKSTNLCKEMIIDMDRSGAKIVYDRFIKGTDLDSENINHIINLVDDYDRWIHSDPDSMYFNAGSSMYSTNPLSDIWYSDPTNIIETGKIINKYSNIVNSKITEDNKYFIKINDKRCIVLNSCTKSSQVFGEYYDKYKFAIRWSFDGRNFNYSIYSDFADIDCSLIAKYFNPEGVGHKGAAGFTSDKLLFKDGYSFRIKMSKD